MDQGIAAGLSGLTASAITNPMEMYRIRIQVRDCQSERRARERGQVHRTSYGETAARMMRNEGWSVFTKVLLSPSLLLMSLSQGLGPRLLNNCLYSMAVMVGYEYVKRICVLEEYRHAVKW